VALKEQLEDEPDLLRLDGIDGELLLDAGAAPFGLRGRVAEGGREPFQNPCRAFSFIARSTCLAFSFDWYSSKSAITCRIITCAGSSPSSWVIETSRTPCLASLRT
jgi:hypothetical protein